MTDKSQYPWTALADLVSDCYNVQISRCSSTEKKLGTEYAKVVMENEPRKKQKEFTIECNECGNQFIRYGYRKPKWYAHPEMFYCNRCNKHGTLRKMPIIEVDF